jgi:hypothetical protein
VAPPQGAASPSTAGSGLLSAAGSGAVTRRLAVERDRCWAGAASTALPALVGCLILEDPPGCWAGRRQPPGLRSWWADGTESLEALRGSHRVLSYNPLPSCLWAWLLGACSFFTCCQCGLRRPSLMRGTLAYSFSLGTALLPAACHSVTIVACAGCGWGCAARVGCLHACLRLRASAALPPVEPLPSAPSYPICLCRVYPLSGRPSLPRIMWPCSPVMAVCLPVWPLFPALVPGWALLLHFRRR